MMKKGSIMQKTMWLSMVLCCVLSGVCLAGLVDDFDSYATGAVDTVTLNWKGIASPALAVIRTDPLDTGNQVLGVTESNTNNGVYGILSGDAIIPNGATKTLFLRILTPVSSASAPNTAFGLIDLDVPPANCWSSISTFVRINNGAIQARDGSAANWGPARPVAANTWYNVWIVTNHASKTFELYVNEGSGGAIAADQVGGVYAFRAVHNNDLDRFVTQAQGTTQILFDDFYVMSGADLRNPLVPIQANTPTPENGADGVGTVYDSESVQVTLQWKPGRDPNDAAQPYPVIRNYYVYLSSDQYHSSDPNLYYVDDVAAGDPLLEDVSYGPVLLNLDGQYVWRVDTGIDNGLGGVTDRTDPNTITGPVWTFETRKSVPDITLQPVGVRVFPDVSAQFTTEFTSVSPAEATWLKYVDGVNDTVLVNGAKYVIETTDTRSTLTVSDVELADQAYYYCLLENQSGQPIPTDHVGLSVNRKLAHYAFEGDFNDQTGTAHGTGLSVNPEHAAPGFTTGIVDNEAVSLNGVSQYVDTGTAAFPQGGLGGGMAAGTLSCWVKANQPGVIYSNYNDNLGTTGLTGFGLSLTAGTASNARIHVRGQTPAGQPMDVGATEGRPSADATMIDGQWHHVAATWQSGEQLRMYVNGVQVSSATAGAPETFAAWELSSVIGAIRTAADRSVLGTFFGGAIDDLRVYNYALDKYTVADLYHTPTGLSACIEPYASQYDFNGNCVVDLSDFAAMAAQWLDCGLYPECP